MKIFMDGIELLATMKLTLADIEAFSIPTGEAYPNERRLITSAEAEPLLRESLYVVEPYAEWEGYENAPGYPALLFMAWTVDRVIWTSEGIVSLSWVPRHPSRRS